MSAILRALCVVLVGALVTACSTEGLAPAGSADETSRAAAAARGAPTSSPATSAAALPRPPELPASATGMPMMGMDPEATATPRPAPNWDELPVAAMDPIALAKQLAVVEAALRDPNVTGAQLAYMGHLQQLAYGRLVDYPEWKDTVFTALSAQARAAVIGSLEAGKQLRSMGGAIPSRLPDWKIVEAPSIDDLLSYYKDAEAEFGVPWQYLAAIHLVETRMGRIRGLSSAGAQGPMQFMPPTWAQYGKGDVNDAHDAILGAARYLRAAGAPGNMPKALFAYNHSNGYVNALIAYAEVMRADPASYRGYHGWQVYFPTRDGSVLLPVGWTKG